MSTPWTTEAVRRIERDYQRSADTHLFPVALPALGSVQIYLKDESTHPTGSLKHRLARSLFLYALCNGWIGEGTTVIESSSGSTAVSEAYFARLLGLPFVAVMPRSTSAAKVAQIAFYGGRSHFVERATRSTPRPSAWRASATATTWTSSPTPSAPPTGAATTTSRSPSSSR
jgi:cysteine synthase A